MGMGEPMMNLDNVLEACRRLPDVGHHAPAHGDLDGRLDARDRGADRERHADPAGAVACTRPTTSLRSQIMPVNDRYPLSEVLAACDRFYEGKKRMIFIEYVMLKGVNDSLRAGRAAGRRARPQEVQDQPDPLQPDRLATTARGARRSAAFQAALEEHGIGATVRLTRGRDIDAACGQLAAKALASAS